MGSKTVRRRQIFIKWLLAALFLYFFISEIHDSYSTMGLASWYGGRDQGDKTANGEIFDMYKLTAAHRRLPFGTMVKVTRLSNKHSVTLRINDRGPYIPGRIIDLSMAAAAELGMVRKGVAKVKMEVLEQ